MTESYPERLRRLGLALDRAMPRRPCTDAEKIATFDHLWAKVTEIPFENSDEFKRLSPEDQASVVRRKRTLE